MTYANIKFSFLKEDECARVFDAHPFLKPLVEKLALDHPEWALEFGDYKFHGDTPLLGHKFIIMEGLEVLGTVSLGTLKRKRCYVIRNERIEKMRKPSIGIKVTDFNEAIAQVNNFFKPKTPAEKSVIRHCKIGYKCTLKWAELKEIPCLPKIRSCETCNSHVYLCDTDEELLNAIKGNKCVAVINFNDVDLSAFEHNGPELMGRIIYPEEDR